MANLLSIRNVNDDYRERIAFLVNAMNHLMLAVDSVATRVRWESVAEKTTFDRLIRKANGDINSAATEL